MADLIFLHCNHDPHCRARVDKHFEGYHTLQLMESGAVELFYDADKFDLEIPSFWPAFPGPRIRFHAARGVHTWNHRYAAFSGPRVETWKRSGLWSEIPASAPRPKENFARFDELLALIRRGGQWGTRRAIHTLESLLLELAESRADTQTDAPWLRQTRQFLEETSDFAPDYAQLARELGLGLSTLRRNFKTATGTSLHEALLQIRLEKARQMLGETNAPIKQIAAQLGYRDVYFFSNQFKRLSGATPATFRRSRQN
ncbi:MAG TPA: AraC family transcriptional regulator [Abditibacterium sp.]|jgi:AraC-like DNA-binding protein